MKKYLSDHKNILIIILSPLLIGVSLVGGYLAGNHHVTVKDKFENSYPLISPMRSLIDQKDFITNLQPLREAINGFYEKEKLENELTIYVEILNTGASIIIDSDMRVAPASLLKVPTAMTVMKKIEREEWSLGNKLVLFENDIDADFGQEYSHVIGTTFTIDELLRKTLVDSDNTAYRILMRNLTLDEVSETLEAMGLTDIVDDNHQITVREYSRIFRSLYYSSFLKRENSEKILELMTQSPFKSYLQGGVSEIIDFSHKIGIDDHSNTYLDAGIFYAGERPYLMAVAVVGREKHEAETIMKELSRLVYQYVSTY